MTTHTLLPKTARLPGELQIALFPLDSRPERKIPMQAELLLELKLVWRRGREMPSSRHFYRGKTPRITSNKGRGQEPTPEQQSSELDLPWGKARHRSAPIRGKESSRPNDPTPGAQSIAVT